MIPAHWISAIANHLWQSTLFAALVVLLALALKRNHARTRHALWFAASMKFLIPFALLVWAGSHLGQTTAAPAAQPGLLVIEQIGQPFASTEFHGAGASARQTHSPAYGHLGDLFFALWFAGFITVFLRWLISWRRVRSVLRRAQPLREGREAEALRRMERCAGVRKPVALVVSGTPLEPGIFGLFQPTLVLPEGIAGHLTNPQLESILAHELCHVRRRDNLTAAFHMLVQAIFWFHPLVWWLGARLIEEREGACDEGVLRLGSEPQTYAESILKTCRFCLESPLACMSGVTGADLKERIARIMSNYAPRIMSNYAPRRLNFVRRALLLAAGMAAVGGPVTFGLLNEPQSRAQSPMPPVSESFEVASIKPGVPSDKELGHIRFAPGGRFVAENVPLKLLIRVAYKVQDFQISGAPGWVASEPFTIEAKSADSGDPRMMKDSEYDAFEARLEARLQALLSGRFNLKLHRETKEMPVYALVAAKDGPKLKSSAPNDGQPKRRMMMRPGRLIGAETPTAMLAHALSDQTGRIVIDRTGLSGTYDFQLEWTPGPGEMSGMAPPPGAGNESAHATDVSAPSLFTAIQEQLGLRLESEKGPVEVLVIDHVEKPSAN